MTMRWVHTVPFHSHVSLLYVPVHPPLRTVTPRAAEVVRLSEEKSNSGYRVTMLEVNNFTFLK